jgi:hypothetical protein
MTQPTRPGRSPVTWTVVGVLLAIGVAGTLIVPIYARSSPKAGAFPFFYWYQLAWIPLVAILSFACYLLVRRTGRGSLTADDGHEGRRDEQR